LISYCLRARAVLRAVDLSEQVLLVLGDAVALIGGSLGLRVELLHLLAHLVHRGGLRRRLALRRQAAHGVGRYAEGGDPGAAGRFQPSGRCHGNGGRSVRLSSFIGRVATECEAQ